jgi:hypothetical protein
MICTAPLIKKDLWFTMMLIFVIVGTILVILGGALLLKPGLFAAIEGLGMKINAPVGLVVLVLGLFTLSFLFTQFYKMSGATSSSHSESSPAESGQAALPSAFPALPTTAITITSPDNRSGVNGKFIVTGTAPDLGSDKLWLLVWAGNSATSGNVYYRSTSLPIAIDNGVWSTPVGQLGGPGKDIGVTFELRLIRANQRCSDSIENAKPDSSGTFIIQRLPSGCTNVAKLFVKKIS